MPRTYHTWGDWEAINTKKSKGKGAKVDEQKREAQRTKFARCRVCGKQMTYLNGTNILVCKNEVEKKKTRVNELGETVEYTVSEECGNVNIVDTQYQDYMRYLFA